jgi:hypothetical protein
MNSPSSGQDPLAGSCKHRNEPSGYIKGEKLNDQLQLSTSPKTFCSMGLVGLAICMKTTLQLQNTVPSQLTKQ